jgi:adenylate cyclase class IV
VREDHSIDIPIEQAEDLRIILEKLGYEVLVAFRKVRTRYKIAESESEIEIEFDEKVTLLHEDKEIPMGSFLQVSLESELPEDISIDELEKDLMENYAKRLGFSGRDRIDTTYVEIALEKLKREN